MANLSDRVKLVGSAAALLLVIGLAFSRSSYAPSLLGSNLATNANELKVASWNMAAINNNPFEYWLTLSNEHYDSVMNSVQEFIMEPGDKDVKVKEVFTQAMFDELVATMQNQGGQYDRDSIKAVTKLWKSDFSQRRIVSDFIRDGELGQKRLTSMPDRITNTVALRDGTFAYRPTVINCFAGSLDSTEEWWSKWRKFMFMDAIDTVKVGSKKPADMLAKIPRAKYPLLTVEEERISVPLQTLICAIFDSILVHMLNTLDAELLNGASQSALRAAPEGDRSWQGLRSQICHSLNLKKNDRILEILKDAYSDRDVISLQEVAGAFIERAKADKTLTKNFHIAAPIKRSASDQNSVILLSKHRFPAGVIEDATNRLKFQDPKAIAAGDITLVRASDLFNRDFIIGSFHGDTNGLASIPLITAVAREAQRNELLILGLDANTYSSGVDGKKQDVLKFAEAYRRLKLDSCWGPVPNPEEFTTYNARTFLQPQLNKASSKAEIREKGDVNPKDFILFRQGTFNTEIVSKDNTGHREYVEEMVFPTLEFPSDHGVLSATLAFSDQWRK